MIPFITTTTITTTTTTRDSEKPVQKQKKKVKGRLGKTTHTLLHDLHIFKRHPDPPRAPEMPPRLARQVLHHDAAEHDELRVDAVEDGVVGEVEAVGDFGGEPGWLLVSWVVAFDR